MELSQVTGGSSLITRLGFGGSNKKAGPLCSPALL